MGEGSSSYLLKWQLLSCRSHHGGIRVVSRRTDKRGFMSPSPRLWPAATIQEVEYAVQMAWADGFVQRLPQGYDTVIGEQGATLSEGERRGITIARALLRDAPILSLDRPTSSVDTDLPQRSCCNDFSMMPACR